MKPIRIGHRLVGWLLAFGLVVLAVPARAEASPVQRGSELTVDESCASPAPHGFSAVVVGSYADVAVGWLLELGITAGTTPGRFSPSQPVTRGQMAVFLWRSAGAPTLEGTHGFIDVNPGAYYEDAVTWLVSEGITTGTSPEKYSPSQSVTRGQMAVFLWRTAGAPAAVGPHGFIDVTRGAYYEVAVTWLVGEGITSGTSPKKYSPSQPVIRGQMAVFLHRAACGSPATVSRYGPDNQQTITVIQEGGPGKPVLVTVPGGGYHGLTPGITAVGAEHLPGWRVLQVSYRPGTVDQVEAQVEAAFNWVADHAVWVGAQPADVRFSGESSGGQAAVRAVLKNDRFPRNKVYSLAGTTELDVWYERWVDHPIADIIRGVTGCTTVSWTACPAVRDGSPSTHARQGPQLFFIHGDQDGMVPPNMGQLSVDRYPYPASSRVVAGNHLDVSFVAAAARVMTST